MAKKEKVKAQVLESIREYYKEIHARKRPLKADKSFANYGGRYSNDEETVNPVGSLLNFWLTAGSWAHKFETRLAKWSDVKYCALTNSGSSANLLAFFTLTSLQLGEKRVKGGDKVITTAVGFPTTVNLTIQYGAISVLVDVCLPGFSINVTKLEETYVEGKTKAVIIAHSLGNPFNVEAVKEFCNKHSMQLVEDNRDALSSEYTIDGAVKKTGTWGHTGASFFYSPHHVTMGEGGAVHINDSLLNKITRSFRDQERDCWCVGGVNNTCGCCFTGQFGQLPDGYDHRYVYSHFEFDLKVTDTQTTTNCAQSEKLDDMTAKHRSNYKTLYEGLKDVPSIILPITEKNSNPSWFGFLITVEKGAGFTRNELTKYIEDNKIQIRNLFTGNPVKHPAFNEVRGDKSAYHVVDDLRMIDSIMNNGLRIGVYPGMTQDVL